jgi:DNA-binding XRE family transcriptional regulator
MSVRTALHYRTVTDSVAHFCDPTAVVLRIPPPIFSALPGEALGAMSETFAERLRRLRREQGYTIVDLAAAVGAAEGTIRQLESGNVKAPNFLLGIRLADQLKVDPRFLALGEGVGIVERVDALERRVTKLEQRAATRR